MDKQMDFYNGNEFEKRFDYNELIMRYRKFNLITKNEFDI